MSIAITRKIRLVSALPFDDEVDEAMPAYAGQSLVIEPLVTHVLPMEKASDAFSAAKILPRATGSPEILGRLNQVRGRSAITPHPALATNVETLRRETGSDLIAATGPGGFHA